LLQKWCWAKQSRKFREGLNMSTVQLKGIVEKWQGKRIGVIGDVMLDHYIEGEITRISPEAPVPIVNVTREWYAPGGAANVAANIAALGGAAELHGVVGTDNAGEFLAQELKNRGVCFCFEQSPSRPTTEKTRVLVRNQQLMRIDREVCTPLVGQAYTQRLWNSLCDWECGWDAVALSDYAKGVFATALASHIIVCANQRRKPVIGDPKPQNVRAFYGATVVMPNMFEAAEVLRVLKVADCKAAAALLQTNFLVTAGGGGMTLHTAETQEWIPTVPRDVYDVVGAGDTVVAAVVLALSVGAPLLDAARIANAAAGVVVGKRGTATVSTEELLAALDELDE
jgi:D-beta-D-heptose 7-phosphate kinase/D-beta-D-heptose 1-phosphate adenosyltransferase